MYKKIIIALCLLAGMAQAQKNRVGVDSAWAGRVVPVSAQRVQTWLSFYNKINEPALGTGSIVMSSALAGYATTNTAWGVIGNAISNYTSFVGSNNGKSTFIGSPCPSSPVLKIDSMKSCSPPVGGWKHFNQYELPAGGEPVDFLTSVTDASTLTGNNYNVRSTFQFQTSQNASAYRLGALLANAQINAASTGSLGYFVGAQVSTNILGMGYTERSWGLYAIAANRSAASTGTVNDQAAIEVLTYIDSGKVNFNRGISIRTPLATSNGTLTNDNVGLYINDQVIGTGTSKYAIYTVGAATTHLGGLIEGAGALTIAGNATVTGSVMTPSIYGGTGLSQPILIAGTTNTNAAGTSTSIILGGGASGTTNIGAYILNNGNVLLPNSRTLQGLDGSNVIKNIINTSGGNLTIGAADGNQDITINPTNTNRFTTFRSYGGVGFCGVASPAGIIHIGTRGVTTAGTAPLVLTTTGSSLLATPIAGGVEVNASGTLFYSPAASTRYQVGTILTATATVDIPSTLPSSISTVTMGLTGAAVGDVVDIGIPTSAIVTGGIYSLAWVSATNVVSIRFYNTDLSSQDPGSGTFKATVIKN